MLDFQEPRRVKAQVECEAVETDRDSFSKALTELVQAGYLTEHPRDAFRVRVLTLTWSLKK